MEDKLDPQIEDAMLDEFRNAIMDTLLVDIDPKFWPRIKEHCNKTGNPWDAEILGKMLEAADEESL